MNKRNATFIRSTSSNELTNYGDTLGIEQGIDCEYITNFTTGKVYTRMNEEGTSIPVISEFPLTGVERQNLILLGFCTLEEIVKGSEALTLA